MKALQKDLEKVFPVLLSFLLVGLFAGSAFSQGTQPASQKKEMPEGSYINKNMRLYILPPKGLEPLPEEMVKEIAITRRKQGKVFEQLGDKIEELPVHQVLFRSRDFDPSMREVMVMGAQPPMQSLEEFEKVSTPEYLTVTDRQTLTIHGRECFLLDRHFKVQETEFRQYCAYVKDYLPGGYLLVFQAVAADFDLYQQAFLDSLNSFRLAPPPVPKEGQQRPAAGARPGMKQPGGPATEEEPAWRSLPVICSLLFVAACILWFIVKKLSVGAKETSEGGEG